MKHKPVHRLCRHLAWCVWKVTVERWPLFMTFFPLGCLIPLQLKMCDSWELQIQNDTCDLFSPTAALPAFVHRQKPLMWGPLWHIMSSFSFCLWAVMWAAYEDVQTPSGRRLKSNLATNHHTIVVTVPERRLGVIGSGWIYREVAVRSFSTPVCEMELPRFSANRMEKLAWKGIL